MRALVRSLLASAAVGFTGWAVAYGVLPDSLKLKPALAVVLAIAVGAVWFVGE